MKRISYVIIPLVAVLLATGCKDNLTMTPNDQVSSETFWTSENDARLALNGCYSYLSGGFSNIYMAAATDNGYAQHPWESNATAIAAGDIDATIDQGYNGTYQSIRRTNYFLANVEKTPMDSALMQRFIAEARFLRADEYFDLAWTFGPVPLITEPFDDPHSVAVAPTPEKDVIDFVLSELTDVAKVLPESYSGGESNEVGRVTKGAALALKARIELYYEKWEDAAKDAQKVMGMDYKLFRVKSLTKKDTLDTYSRFVDFSGQADRIKFYKGLASYTQQFYGANDENSGVILASQNISDNNGDWGEGAVPLLPPADLGGWSSIVPSQALVNAYWKRNGEPFQTPSRAQRAADYKDGSPNTAYFNEFKNRDTRLYASILFPTDTWNAYQQGYTFQWNKVGSNSSKTGYNFKKFLDPKYTEVSWDGEQDFPLIRYAEVLLTYAEAKNEVSGPDQTVYAAIDSIRSRAGMPKVNESEYNNQEKMRKLIHNERRIELVGEGQRYDDIRRWGIAKDVMHDIYDINNEITQQRSWKDNYVKMPYPQRALDHNPNLEDAQAAKGY